MSIQLSKKDKNGNEVTFFKRLVRYRQFYFIHSTQILRTVLFKFGVAVVRSTKAHCFTLPGNLVSQTKVQIFVSLFPFFCLEMATDEYKSGAEKRLL